LKFKENFSSDFQKDFIATVVLKPSLLVNWELPEQSNFGQEIKSLVSLENISQEIASSAEVIIDFPNTFAVKEAYSKSLSKKELEEIEIISNGNQIKWKIKDLNPKDKKALEFKGFLKDPQINELNFSLEAGLLNKGKFFSQIRKEKKIFLENFDFKTNIGINNIVAKEQVCGWGDILPITLTYVNQTNQKIKDFSLKMAIINKEHIDFDRFYQSHWRYYQKTGKQVGDAFISGKMSADVLENGWNNVLIPVFNEILPNTEGRIVFDLPVKTILQSAKQGGSEAKIVLKVSGKGILTQGFPKCEIKGNEIDLFIKTDLNLIASACYYNDERVVIGKGPLPPQVGQESVFWIFWELKNTTNPVNDILIKTKLPDNVLWSGETKTNKGLLLYEKDIREVSWQISHLDSYQGGPYSLVQGGFAVKIIPSEQDLGKVIPLTKEIFMTAKDELTNDLISQQISPLDTNLKNDPWFYGQGQVIENKD